MIPDRDLSQGALDAIGKRKKLMRVYRRQVAMIRETVLDCPEGPRVRALVGWARTLQLCQAEELIEQVKVEFWLLKAPEQTRRVALAMLNDAIIQIRRRNNLPPFDDPLDGSPSAYAVLQTILRLS